MKNKPIGAEDKAFLSSLFERHLGIVYKTALNMDIRDESAVIAVVHETLLKLSPNVETLRGMSERARVSYIAAAARSVVLSREARRRAEARRLSPLSVEDIELTADQSLEDAYIESETRRQRIEAMWAALDELPPDDRALLLEKYLDGRSDAELAAARGLRPESVRKKLSRVRRRARGIILGKEGDGHDA